MLATFSSYASHRPTSISHDFRKIDVMYLYTKGVKEVLGDISDIQVQTTIATAIATTNQAMNNSKIDLEISPVHIGSVSPNSSSLDCLSIRRVTAKYSLSFPQVCHQSR